MEVTRMGKKENKDVQYAPIPLGFELNKNEIKQIRAIASEIETELNNLKTVTIYGKEAIFDDKNAQKTISVFSKRILDIRNKAHERSMKYYSSHREKIPDILKNEAQQFILFMQEMEKDNTTPNPPEKYKEMTISFITPYLDLLPQEKRSDILNYITDVFDNPEKISQEAQIKETSMAKKAKGILHPVDKVTKSVFDTSKNSAFFSNGVDLKMGKKGKEEIITTVSMRADKLENVKFSNSTMLNPYCRAVIDAINSLYNAGNKLQSINMIHRTMTGKDTPEEKASIAISEAISAIMHTVINIDATKEAQAFGFETLKFEGQLLPAQFITAQINGRIVDCLKILAEPPLLTYARRKSQLNTYDAKHLHIPFETLSATQENIIIVNFLLDRIYAMFNKNNSLKNIIRYDSLYELLKLEAPTEGALRVKKKDIRNKVHKALDAWVKANLIGGYQDLDDDDKPAQPRKTIAKVKITPPRKKLAEHH